MKRYFVGYKMPGGLCGHFVMDARDESDARKQFWEEYSGLGYRILCVVNVENY